MDDWVHTMSYALAVSVVEFDGPTPRTWNVSCCHCGLPYVFPVMNFSFDGMTKFSGQLRDLLKMWRIPINYDCPLCGTLQDTLSGYWEPYPDYIEREFADGRKETLSHL